MRYLTAVRSATLLSGLSLVSASAAWAADAEGGKTNLLAVDPWTVIVALVTFGLVLLVLAKYAWGPLLAGMKSREEKIQSALDEAQAANEQARALIGEYENKLAEAKDEAAAIAEEARRDALDIKNQIESEARASAEASVERAKIEIQRLSEGAWDTIVKDAAGIATQAAGKIIGRELTPEGHAELVHEVVAEFGRKRAGGAAS